MGVHSRKPSSVHFFNFCAVSLAILRPDRQEVCSVDANFFYTFYSFYPWNERTR